MVVYADILMLVNFIVDYFLLRLSAVLLKEKPTLLRTVLAAALGSVFSLYIFLPQSPVLAEILIRIVFCFLLSAVGFGVKSFRTAVRRCAVIFGVTVGFAGCMWAVWQIFKPPKMVINNSVVYFDISPLFLILSSVGFYLLFTLITVFFGKKTVSAKRCEVTLCSGDKIINAVGILDTGNGLTDPFSESAVVLANKSDVEKLVNGENKKTAYRPLPCSTVTGAALLDGYRIDKMTVTSGKKVYDFNGVIIAASKTHINENEVILNPAILS